MSSSESPFRSEGHAAIERVAQLADENARLRDELVRARTDRARPRRRRAQRTVLLAVGAIATLACATTAVVASRASGPKPTPVPAAAAPLASVAVPSATPQWLPPPAAPPFDRELAERAVAGVDIQSCASPVHYPDGLNEGVVTITFNPTGGLHSAFLRSPAFDGSAVGGCIVNRFRNLRIPAFSGPAPTMTRSFRLL